MSSPFLQAVVSPYPAITRIGDGLDAYLRAWCIALAVYLVAMIWLMGFHGDVVIADRLYAWEGGAWVLRYHWFTGSWIHLGGKRLSTVMWLACVVMTMAVWHRPAWQLWRRPLLILLGSVLLCTTIVAIIKRLVPMFCPWSLERYGGSEALVGLFQVWPADVRPNACFPAAHASTGFAWVALYFFCLQVAPDWRRWGLAAGVAMGTAFAFSQELRGAHFLSHDLTTIMVCWSVSLFMYVGFRGRTRA